MTQLQISLPEPVDRFLQQQVAEGRYQSAGDCVLDIVEKARVHAAKEKLAQLIREGLESEGGEEATDEYWQRFDKKLQQEVERRQKA